jgi:hypothetical protein
MTLDMDGYGATGWAIADYATSVAGMLSDLSANIRCPQVRDRIPQDF